MTTMPTIDVERTILASEWWACAEAMHDRHYAEHEDVSVADHLRAVARNVRRLLGGEHGTTFVAELRTALAAAGLKAEELLAMLHPAALLHDIGKPLEDKDGKLPHPVTGKMKPARHPLFGMRAAMELLPDDLPCKGAIMALVEEHDTPYAWYRHWIRTGAIPGEKAWARLGRTVGDGDECLGLARLALFKLADVDGHEDVSDVKWFLKGVNAHMARRNRVCLPVPGAAALTVVA